MLLGHPIDQCVEEKRSRREIDNRGADCAVRDRRGNKFVPGSEVVAVIGGLVRVIEFMEITGVVRVKHCGVGVFHGPHDSVGASIGGDAGRGSRIPEAVGTLSDGCRQKPGIFELKREEGRTDWSEIELAEGGCRRGPNSSGKNSG